MRIDKLRKHRFNVTQCSASVCNPTTSVLAHEIPVLDKHATEKCLSKRHMAYKAGDLYLRNNCNPTDSAGSRPLDE